MLSMIDNVITICYNIFITPFLDTFAVDAGVLFYLTRFMKCDKISVMVADGQSVNQGSLLTMLTLPAES